MGFYSSNQVLKELTKLRFFFGSLFKIKPIHFCLSDLTTNQNFFLNIWFFFFWTKIWKRRKLGSLPKKLKIIHFLNSLKFLNHAKSRRKDLHFKATISSMSIALSQSVGWWNDFKTSKCLWTFMQVSGGQINFFKLGRLKIH